eukprot:CAMPEP_0182900484 /NCGR_PEP_ID=MMETSP0034_2-20130328/28885_1 /TAXON_ID=156128 /ORGANISM="Nephroselmis pyriformis, Strain CCMP717" /LENGTH=132 /DNA_ID=CAMNT_0025034705 /DNA_START=392 /DNA_END=788 /DNA_ORIENTATION=+
MNSARSPSFATRVASQACTQASGVPSISLALFPPGTHPESVERGGRAGAGRIAGGEGGARCHGHVPGRTEPILQPPSKLQPPLEAAAPPKAPPRSLETPPRRLLLRQWALVAGALYPLAGESTLEFLNEPVW